MSKLTSEQLKKYKDKGFVSPLNALTKDEAEEVKSEIGISIKKLYQIIPVQNGGLIIFNSIKIDSEIK